MKIRVPASAFVLEPVDVGDGGADEVVHELELAPDRHAEFFELGLVGDPGGFGDL